MTIYREDSSTIYLPLVISCVVHLFFIVLLLMDKPDLPAARIIQVSIVPELGQQIVSPSEKTEDRLPPKEILRQSDTDSVVEKEQLRRGDNQAVPVPPANRPLVSRSPATAIPPSKPSSQMSQKPNNKPEQRRTGESGKLILKLDPNNIPSPTLKRSMGDQPRQQQLEPFSRPPGSAAQFYGSAGSRDYLPNVPDGDLTLLNAKAEKYATFVRRVAEQVFRQLQSTGWERLNAEEIQRLTTSSTVRAWMDSKGQLLKVALEGSSGSDKFDRTLVDSAKAGTRDSHPPQSAALADGTIQFVFKARTWVQYGYNPRTKSPREERWLMLGTGLE